MENCTLDWISLLKTCSKKIRKSVLEIFGSAEADVAFGVGAGGDIMKKIDLVAEEALTETLRDQGVSYTLISEETGIKEIGDHPSDYYLTFDPVDGTTNATRGLPFIATSIAVSREPFLQDVEVALVTDLFHDVTYTAKRTQGAHRNGKRIKPSQTSSLEEAVMGVDFTTFKIKELVASLTNVLSKVRYTRHLGANALEVCYVADGTTDAFIDIRGKLRVTDIAAAYLILKEAGGMMVTPEGKEMKVPLAPTQRVSFIAAANFAMYNSIKELLRP